MALYTSDDLITSIELKSFAPDSQITFSSSDILIIASEVLLNIIVPAIVKTRTDYFIFTKDFTITALQDRYIIPSRALDGILRGVFYINDENHIVELSLVDLTEPSTLNPSGPYCYYLEDDAIVLYPKPDSTRGTLRVKSFVSPGDLVSADSGAVISTINTVTSTITVSVIPSTWTTGNTFDLISQAGSHAYRDLDNISTLISGTSITFTSLPSNLVVGDYVNLVGQSSLVQIPASFRSALAHLTAAEMLSSQNQAGSDESMEKGKAYLQNAIQLLMPRVKGMVQVISPKIWF